MPAAAVRNPPVVVLGVRCCSRCRGQAPSLADYFVRLAGVLPRWWLGLVPPIVGPLTRLGSTRSVRVAAAATAAAMSMAAVTEPMHGEDQGDGDDPDPVAS